MDRLDRVAVALDTADRSEFRRWCQLFGPRVGVLKVGLEAFVRWGPEAVNEARRAAPELFLDLKLHDIPNTVAGAVAAAGDLGVDYLTVHAGGGEAMLRAAAAAAKGRPRILAVTLLTSLDGDALRVLAMPGSVAERVARWTALARDAGCAGVVCSPAEARDLRAIAPRPFLLVTPGIRAAGEASGDQRRTATPGEALAAGADLLVVGRPLTRAADPEAALEALAASLAG
jgi:orotidine-5'-phosphate decarboxylase